MAKGLRASTHKANKVRLRTRVFAPVEDARTKRLSARLLDLASRPRSSKDSDMRWEEGSGKDMGQQQKLVDTDKRIRGPGEDMDVDSPLTTTNLGHSVASSKIPKRRRRNDTTSMFFPVHEKQKRLKAKRRMRK